MPGPVSGAELERLCAENLVSVIALSSGDSDRDLAELAGLSRYALTRFKYYELLIVAAAPRPGWLNAMRAEGHRFPHARIIVMDARLAYEDLAGLSLRHVIGDYVVSLVLGEGEAGHVEAMLTPLASGDCEIVKMVHGRDSVALSERLSAGIAGWLVRAATGHRLEPFQTRSFAMSRTAVSRVAAVGGAMKFFRILDLSGQISERRLVTDRPRRRRFWSGLGEKLRLVAELVSLSAARLILTLAIVSFALSLASILATFAALAIKFTMEDVAPGWASLAVLFSALFAANFGVLGSICLGVLQLLRQGRSDTAGILTTEVSGGDLFLRSERYNVETAENAEPPLPATVRAAGE